MSRIWSKKSLISDHERRRHPRRTTPIRFTIEGHGYWVRDYSVGGFGVPSFHRDLRPGDEVTGQVMQFWFLNAGPFTAQVVRRADTGYIGFRFIDLSGAVFGRLTRM